MAAAIELSVDQVRCLAVDDPSGRDRLHGRLIVSPASLRFSTDAPFMASRTF